ncbi:MAG TPA: metallophosphoesterase [Polyangia bacterium]|nr:metallophosphoesterase [Polyangia bacterium]
MPASGVWFVVALAAGLALGAGCNAAVAHTEDPAFTIVVLPDTQYYAREYPDILTAQVDWIARERERAGIALVAHEGDIVDADEPAQWERAATTLHALDGVVPLLLSAGNHDYRRDGRHIDRRTSINQYFAPATAGGTVEAVSTFEPGHLENSSLLLSAPGGPWLLLSLEFGPRDAVLAWADSVLDRHARVPAILVTHAYLDADGARYDHVGHPGQLWNPHRYFAADAAGGVNDGQEIWQKLVSRHDNLRFVLCGHALDDGTGRLTSRRADGSSVQEILANFQTAALGGGGFLRIMRFSPAQRTVAVQTYSPYLDRWKRDPDNEFTVRY